MSIGHEHPYPGVHSPSKVTTHITRSQEMEQLAKGSVFNLIVADHKFIDEIYEEFKMEKTIRRKQEKLL